MNDMNHMNYLEDVAFEDIRELRRKEATYQGSWKRRGGVGAYMMAVRKSDRLEEMLKNGYRYNVFTGIERDMSGKDGSVLAEVRDLRRYLLLIEAEMMARTKGAVIAAPPSPVPLEDSNKHAERAPGTKSPVFASPTPAMEEAGLHTEDTKYVVNKYDVDGIVANSVDGRPAGSRAPYRVIIKGSVTPASPDDPNATRYLIVDRQLVDDLKSMDHLLKLRTGLNNVEFQQDVPPWFQHMYRFDEHERNEWVLQPRYKRWSETGHR